MDDYQRLAELYKALGHPMRLRILDVLAQREACVCHLTALLGLRQPYVSQQLGTLRDAGIVVGRRDGTLVFYRLRDARMAALLALAHTIQGTAGDPPASDAQDVNRPIPGCQCPACRKEASDEALEAEPAMATEWGGR